MTDTNKSIEFFINEINLLTKENEELKKKLSTYEKEQKEKEGIKNSDSITQQWIQKNKKIPLTSYEKQQMQLESIRMQNIVRRQRFRDNYSI